MSYDWLGDLLEELQKSGKPIDFDTIVIKSKDERLIPYLARQQRWSLLEETFRPDAALYAQLITVKTGRAEMPTSFFWRDDIPLDIKTMFRPSSDPGHMPWDWIAATESYYLMDVGHCTSEVMTQIPDTWSLYRLPQCVVAHIYHQMPHRREEAFAALLRGIFGHDGIEDETWDVIRSRPESWFLVREAINHAGPSYTGAPQWFLQWAVSVSPVEDGVWEYASENIGLLDILGTEIE